MLRPALPRNPARVRLLILTLLTFGTLINYLDRTVISVAAPLMTTELGLDAVTMGIVFSAFSWTYAAAQIPGGILLDRIGVRLTYFLSVTVWSAFTLLQGLVDQPLDADRLPHGTGPCGSARLSVEQPGTRHLVPAGRARLGHRRLFRRPVLRPRLPEPAALLDCGRLRLARVAHHRRRGGNPVRLRLVCALSGSAREPGQQGRARLHHRGRRARCHVPHEIRVAPHRLPAAPAADRRRVDRPVREQFHAGVLPHLVPHLPCDRAADGLDQGRVLHRPAVHRGLRWRDERRLAARTICCAARVRRTSRASCPSSRDCCWPRPS